MSKLTIALGVVLVLLGIIGYFATNMQSMTALIPSAFGVVFVVIGAVALDPARRKYAMHAAAALSVLGLAGTFPGIMKAFRWAQGATPERPAAVVVQVIMFGLLLIFLVLCVQSFMAARRQRGFDTVPPA